MSQNQDCPFCGKVLTTPTCVSCADVFYPILAGLVKKQTNKTPALEDIDNLIFQGGGVKGVCYLGVLDRLGDDFVSKVKRIAGTSAGSMCALYLGLNKNKDELYDLIYSKNFADLLDDGEIVTIHYWTWRPHKRHFTSKAVVLAAMNYLNDNPEIKDPQVARVKMEKFIKYIVEFIAGKIGGVITKAIVTMLLNIFSFIKKLISGWFKKIFSSVNQNETQQPDQPSTNNQHIDNIVDEVFERELQRIQDEQNQGGNTQTEEVKSQEVDESDDPSELKDEKILCYSVTELLWDCLVGNGGTPKDKTAIGLFAANKIKDQLITGAIRASLEKIGQSNLDAENITFAELAKLTDQSGNLAFKPFYVTSFNTSTLRTEVFSVDHTPNVVVSDAVRASMSIPIFFKTVTIRERPPGQQELAPRLSYSSPTDKGLPILYVDGGLLDNYPIWIFDDLRYCIDGQISQWHPERRVGIQNPKTLGFRIMDQDRMGIYLKPFYDDSEEKVKNVTKPDSIKTYIDILKLIFSVDFDEPQENEYVKFGQIPRSVYVNNMGVSAVDFNLSDDDKKKLVNSGYAAVNDYVSRAEHSFEEEIGQYPK